MGTLNPKLVAEIAGSDLKSLQKLDASDRELHTVRRGEKAAAEGCADARPIGGMPAQPF